MSKLLSMTLAHKMKNKTAQHHTETYIYHKSQLTKLKDMLTLMIIT
jgi:hypothetical protein